ncbi:hypothetical protein VCEM1676A_000425 [Vibrio cholerae O1 str. EM-1676A]|nr:hypothetical protein VCEM1676A_000425 [Vibrio cholerae O1 str. EM-1676A]
MACLEMALCYTFLELKTLTREVLAHRLSGFCFICHQVF